MFGAKFCSLFAIAFIILGWVGLDQLTKQRAQDQLIWHQEEHDIDLYVGRKVPLLAFGEKPWQPERSGSYFELNFRYSRNKGAAFGLLSGLPDHIRIPFFYLISGVALVLIVFYYRSSAPNQYALRLGLVFILAGAFGNLIDRLRYGYVVDFIDVMWLVLGWQHDFAIFNVADIAINIGVLLFLIGMVSAYRNERAQRLETSDLI